jgi:hypothetical protein
MKINIFVPTVGGGNFTDAFPNSSLSGSVVEGPQSPGEEIIDAIDEERMTPEKRVARRFLKFLGNRRLNMMKLTELPKLEQSRLIAEFAQQ